MVGCSTRIAVTPAALHGRVDASATFLSTVLLPLAPLLGGLALDQLGGRPATIALTTALVSTALVGTALVVTLSRDVRRAGQPRGRRGRAVAVLRGRVGVGGGRVGA